MADTFSLFLRAIIDGDVAAASRLLAADPALATERCAIGATRGGPAEWFYADIAHYCYRGDTALHMAAAAFQKSTAQFLIEHGAALDTRNRRGAEPLHYGADTNHWNPAAQADTISYLLSVGANVNARDANGATPLHRAVRTRSAAAVRALLAGGADVRARNKNGSTPADLAVCTTGRGGSGSAHAKVQQAEIIALLRDVGARPTRGT
jgi:hypothetical protein